MRVHTGTCIRVCVCVSMCVHVPVCMCVSACVGRYVFVTTGETVVWLEQGGTRVWPECGAETMGPALHGIWQTSEEGPPVSEPIPPDAR